MTLLTRFPGGADYIVCPKCENMFYNCTIGDDLNCEDDYYKDIMEFYFCKKCEFVFRDSHTYKALGCTDDIDFVKYVTKYKVNGEVIESNVKKEHLSCEIEILETKCSCNGSFSPPKGC